MCIGTRKKDRQRKSLLIYQNTALCPHFFLGLLDFSQQTPKPEVLLPYSRPNFATPSRFLPVHRTVPDLLPIFFQKSPLQATFGTSYVRCSRCHIPGAGLSIDSPFATHRISPPGLSLPALACVPVPVHEHSSFSDLVPFSEYLPGSFPKIRLRLSRTGNSSFRSFSRPCSIIPLYPLFWDRL